MSRIIITGIAILIISNLTFAQNEDKSPCPEGLSVTGPSNLISPSEPQIFVAEVIEPGKHLIQFHWTISGGEIIKGIGTSSITVVQPKESAGSNLTATVELIGLPENCGVISASETAVISDVFTVPMQIDEISGSLRAVKKINLDDIADHLQKKYPYSKVSLIWYFRSDLSQNTKNRETKRINEYLTKTKGIEKKRIEIQFAESEHDSVAIWIVPLSAESPTPKD